MRARVGGAASPTIVILNPNASDLLPLRKWPTERFQVAGRSACSPATRTRGWCSPARHRSAPRPKRCAASLGSPRVVSVAGETSLPELLTLYSLADVLVTNDSGPGHFASLTPVHAIVLFGPETPRLFGPLSSS